MFVGLMRPSLHVYHYQLKDPEFLVRSFVAMGLGNKRSDESYAALLNLMQFDKDPNVRAEASNSLSKYAIH